MGIDTKRFIEKAMEEARVTSSDLAKKCGVTRQEIYRRLHSRISLDTFAEMAEALGYQVGVLYQEDGKTKGKPLPKTDIWT